MAGSNPSICRMRATSTTPSTSGEAIALQTASPTASTCIGGTERRDAKDWKAGGTASTGSRRSGAEGASRSAGGTYWCSVEETSRSVAGRVEAGARCGWYIRPARIVSAWSALSASRRRTIRRDESRTWSHQDGSDRPICAFCSRTPPNRGFGGPLGRDVPLRHERTEDVFGRDVDERGRVPGGRSPRGMECVV